MRLIREEFKEYKEYEEFKERSQEALRYVPHSTLTTDLMSGLHS